MRPDDQIIGPVQEKGADIVPLPSLEQVREFIRASKAESTLRGYQSDWRHFLGWCQVHDFCPLPAAPEAVASYIAECARHLKTGSIQRRLNAIAEAHKAVGLESPTADGMVRNTLKGIRRTMGTAAVQKAPTLTDDIRAMVDATGAGLIGARDRAVILLGFAGAFRRSEIVGLDAEDCRFSKDGLTITLRRSKTDQAGVGRKIGTRMAGIGVARIVKKLAERAGLDPAKYAGHSLRAGHATTAAIAGASERSIMNQTGHRSVQMVRRYIRDGNLFRENSAGKLGL